MKLLVYGGRDYLDKERVFSILDQYLTDHGPHLIVIHGRCKTGADRFADDWCEENDVDCLRVPAKWRLYPGKSAGPIRNRRMAQFYKPDMAAEFPGNVGTANMRSLCHEFGINIHTIAAP